MLWDLHETCASEAVARLLRDRLLSLHCCFEDAVDYDALNTPAFREAFVTCACAARHRPRPRAALAHLFLPRTPLPAAERVRCVC